MIFDAVLSDCLMIQAFSTCKGRSRRDHCTQVQLAYESSREQPRTIQELALTPSHQFQDLGP